MNDFSQRRAWICGASEGIGLATAHLLAERGASVTLLARRADVMQSILPSLARSQGQEHAFLAIDLSDLEALQQIVSKQTQAVHILINNSGGPAPGPLLKADPAAFLAALQQHVLAAQILTQALVPGMQAAGYGRIINVISTSVKAPIPNLGVSNTIRGAMANWAKTLASELAPTGITVNNVLPGFTDTGRLAKIISTRASKNKQSEAEVRASMLAQVPMKRFAQAEETAAAIAFLASAQAAYITGINLPVDGGRTACL